MRGLSYLPKDGYKKIPVLTFYIALGALLLFLFFRYFLKILLPFLIAYALAALFHPLVLKLESKTGTSRRFFVLLFVFLLLFLLGTLLFFLGGRLRQEAAAFADWLIEDETELVGRIGDFFFTLGEKIPFFGDGEEAVNAVGDAFLNLISSLSMKLPEWISLLAQKLPEFVFSFLITFLALYYFCVDQEKVNRFLFGMLPEEKREKGKKLAGKFFSDLGRILRAYLLLTLITFVQLLIGLLLLRMPYAFLLSLLIAFVDLLPVFGAGTVLFPWAIVLLLTGEVKKGIGLCFLAVVIWITRRIVEPRVIGESIGCDPLALLFSMYLGLRLFGLPGLLLSPFAVVFVNRLLRRREETKT